MTAKLANPSAASPAPSRRRLRRAARCVRSIPTHDHSTAAPHPTTAQEIQLLCKPVILAHGTGAAGRLAAP